MFRSGGQSDAKPPVFSSQASLILIYRPTEGSTLPNPGLEPGPVAWKHDTLPLSLRASILYISVIEYSNGGRNV
ncbi:hypothetical protein TNCV_1900611 [Trichonephila clavipes]|nr:hypothetical protein TNCV_1900611 [Trichonephila clavipes]